MILLPVCWVAVYSCGLSTPVFVLALLIFTFIISSNNIIYMMITARRSAVEWVRARARVHIKKIQCFLRLSDPYVQCHLISKLTLISNSMLQKFVHRGHFAIHFGFCLWLSLWASSTADRVGFFLYNLSAHMMKMCWLRLLTSLRKPKKFPLES